MKFIVLALLVATVLSANQEIGKLSLVYQNNDAETAWMYDSTVGRSKSFSIEFSEEFGAVPEIALSFTQLDLFKTFPHGFEIEAQKITTKGFDIVVTINQDKGLHSLNIQYLAVLDANIVAGRVTNIEFGDNLKAATAGEQLDFEYSIDYDISRLKCKNFVGSVFLTGANIASGGFEANVAIDGLYDAEGYSNFKQLPLISDSGDADITSISISYVIGCKSSVQSYSGGENLADTDLGSGSGLRKSVSYIDQDDSVEVLVKGENVKLFYGINAYDTTTSSNIRIRLSQEPDFVNQEQELATWASTEVDAIFTSYIRFNSTPQCAIVYSKCGFEGDSLSVCSGSPVNSFAVQEWGDKQVKSVQVPSGRTLALFDAENQEGGVVQLTADVACNENPWRFTAPQ